MLPQLKITKVQEVQQQCLQGTFESESALGKGALWFAVPAEGELFEHLGEVHGSRAEPSLAVAAVEALGA